MMPDIHIMFIKLFYFNRHNKIYLEAVLQSMATRTERTTQVIDERESITYKHTLKIKKIVADILKILSCSTP